MALVNLKGNYLKVNNVTVQYRDGIDWFSIEGTIYKDRNQRNAGIGEFESAIPVILQKVYGDEPNAYIFPDDAKIAVVDNPNAEDYLKTGAYLTLKAYGYADWIDA